MTLALSSRERARLLHALLAALLGFVFWPPTASALDPTVPIRHYTHEQWGTADGLPQSSPQAIVQDPVGYLWLATQEGLARFDGVRFTVFDTRSTPSLPANNVTSVLATADGSLLVGMRAGGLIRLFPDETVERIGRGPATETLLVRALLQDRHGRIWIGTRGSGLLRTATANPLTLDEIPGFSGDRILALLEASDGSVWVGTEGHGLAIVRSGDRVTWLENPSGPPENTVWALHEDREGTIWAGTFGGGLVSYSPDGTRTGHLGTREGLSSDRVLSLGEDRQGNLWVGTFEGLDRVRGGAVTGSARGTNLQGEAVLAILEDREGNLWIGTQRSGLHKLGDSRFAVWGGGPGQPPPMARVVLEGHDGTIWFGTSGRGLFRLRPGPEVSRRPEPVSELNAKDVFALYEDPGGDLWIGTYEEGLYRLSRGRLTSWTTADGLPVNTIWALEGDGHGGIWMGTYGGGLALLRDGAVSTISTESGLPSNLVRCLHRTPDGVLWAGLTSGGLVAVKDAVVSRPRGSEALANVSVLDIHDAVAGGLWLATTGAGLCLYETGELSCITSDNGLFDDTMYRILADADGQLWMSSNRGIFRVSEEQARRCARGETPSVTCRVFGRSDGMPTAECNGGSQPCGWKARDGSLWFPTPEGVVSLDPGKEVNASPSLPAVLETVRLGNRVVPRSAGPLVLPPGAPPLELDYTVLFLQSPSNLRFQYRLRGLHTRWIDAGARRAAYFDHLPPGRYEFVVRGGIGGRWGPPSAPLRLEVRPRLTQRPAFYILLLGASLLVASALAGARIRNHKRRAHELELKIAAATRDLRRTSEQLEKANRRLQDLARQDPLTGVANRRHFDELSAASWARCRRDGLWLSVLMIDIDCFKLYNDTYGHQAGDEALVAVASIMRQRIRRATDSIARYGGEEFSVILPNTPPEAAAGLAQELRLAVRAAGIEHSASSVAPMITISIGVASTIPSRGSSEGELIRLADEALYRAKGSGRDGVESVVL